MTPRRTEFAAFVVDLLDFIEEKIGEAIESENSRLGAIGEAAGAVPVLRDRLRENEPVQANFILVLGNIVEQRWASQWRDDFSKMGRGEFERTARDLVERLAILRTLVTEAGASLRSTPERPPPDRIDSAVSNNRRAVMKWMFAAVFAAAIAIASAPRAEAKGCIKGAIVGGAAGHMAGHGKLGAAAGCVVGHHEANKPNPNNSNAQAPSGQK